MYETLTTISQPDLSVTACSSEHLWRDLTRICWKQLAQHVCRLLTEGTWYFRLQKEKKKSEDSNATGKCIAPSLLMVFVHGLYDLMMNFVCFATLNCLLTTYKNNCRRYYQSCPHAEQCTIFFFKKY